VNWILLATLKSPGPKSPPASGSAAVLTTVPFVQA
jgi:hypothetical protein